jgi:hypothetical protein
MTRLIRIAIISALTLGLMGTVAGCACKKEGDATKCETTVQFQGTAKDADVAWTAGQPISINVTGGNVRVGDMTTSIRVIPGSGSSVKVKFYPFISVVKDEEADGRRQMNELLTLSASNDNGTVNIAVQQTGTHNSSLSARVDVELPAGYNAPINASSQNGDIYLEGAMPSVNAAADGVGDVNVVLTSPITAGNKGSIVSKGGKIGLEVPNSSVVVFRAQTEPDQKISYNATLPANWSEAEGSTASAATLIGNAGTANEEWTLSTVGSAFGKIEIDIK